MKAQLTIQYLISIIVFIGLITYIYISYSANIPAYIQEVRKEATRSKAYQLSELLINDPGEPKNWNQSSSVNEIKRIGLLDQSSNRQNLISWNKTEKLTELTYEQIQERLALEGEQFSIIISKIRDDGSREILCAISPPVSEERVINITITRIIVINDTRYILSGVFNASELIVQM